MDLSIILVNWNAVDYLNECIGSIYEHTHGIQFEIIVVDNASPRGDVEALKVAFPDITIIKSPHNLGFARGNNLGFRRSTGARVLFLNPDTKLVGPAISTILNRMNSLPNAGIVGCKHVNPDLTVQTTSIQKFPTIVNQVFNIEYLRRRWPGFRLWDLAPLFSDNLLPVAVEVIPGACMLLRRELFERVGMFSEEYFMYAEDIDLNRKVERTGFQNYYVPDAAIIHYGGRSSAQRSANEWATVMKFRAMAQYYVKHRGRPYAALYRLAMAGSAIGRLFIMTLAFPVAIIMSSKLALCSAFEKWSAVLKWACGLTDRSLSATGNR